MLTFASTNSFVAGPELTCGVLVGLVTSTLAGFVFGSLSTKCQTAGAFAVNVPAVLLLIVTVQVAVFPLTVGEHAVWLSGCGDTVTVSDVSEAVVPAGSAFVVTVNVCA